MNIVKFQTDSTLQRIKASYIDENMKLTPHEEQIKARLVHYHSLVFDKKYSKHQAIKIHCREMHVSKATAYRDALQAEFVMGNVLKVNVDFQRVMLMEHYFNIYQVSLRKGNELAQLKALDSYKSLIDFHQVESGINPEKLAASEFLIKLHPVARKVF
ncbi:MAG: hypothetical protein Q4F57_02550, partial [Weeksellaceae bacterium]|nr:hypothetical protein [Weeksellaceae bacterium]